MVTPGPLAKLVNTEISTRLTQIRQRIEAACMRAGRSVSEVTLVGVTKTVSAERVREAIEAGLTVLGENRVQEAENKITALQDLRSQVEWHLIGHLQSNKARRAIALFNAIQSVDSSELAARLNRLAEESGKRTPVFIEVNVGGEAAKAGVAPEDVLRLIERISSLQALELRGLMCVPPFLDPQDVRSFFKRLRELKDEAERLGLADQSFKHLSMGMSHDFEVAIEEGATIVRVGTALFGVRT
ncbi:MAG TPA: YggS family pyridoxal phosphate-dependent enzyme [Blastocatellia bacterium]|nr:YggS family pyridoxal phosphate-dependent enzyme [Blastocatellia bacterium]